MSRQIDKILTKQIRIGVKLHRALKLEAAKRGTSIRRLIEELIKKVFDDDDP